MTGTTQVAFHVVGASFLNNYKTGQRVLKLAIFSDPEASIYVQSGSGVIRI